MTTTTTTREKLEALSADLRTYTKVWGEVLPRVAYEGTGSHDGKILLPSARIHIVPALSTIFLDIAGGGVEAMRDAKALARSIQSGDLIYPDGWVEETHNGSPAFRLDTVTVTTDYGRCNDAQCSEFGELLDLRFHCHAGPRSDGMEKFGISVDFDDDEGWTIAFENADGMKPDYVQGFIDALSEARQIARGLTTERAQR